MGGFDRERIEALLSADSYASNLGVELSRVDDQELSLTLTVTDQHTNFLGLGHGGMVFSLADCAFSLASNHSGPSAVAIDTHLALTAPARPGQDLTAVVREVHRGRSLGTYRVDVSRDDGRLVGVFTGTVLISAA